MYDISAASLTQNIANSYIAGSRNYFSNTTYNTYDFGVNITSSNLGISFIGSFNNSLRVYGDKLYADVVIVYE